MSEVAAILSENIVPGLGDADAYLVDWLGRLNEAFLRALLAWANHDGVDVASRVFGMPTESLDVLVKKLAKPDAVRSLAREPFAFVTLDCGGTVPVDSPAGETSSVIGDQSGREHVMLLQVVQCMFVEIARAFQRDRRAIVDSLLGVPAEGRRLIDHMVQNPDVWMQAPRPWVVVRPVLVRRVGSARWTTFERYSVLTDMLLTGAET